MPIGGGSRRQLVTTPILEMPRVGGAIDPARRPGGRVVFADIVWFEPEVRCVLQTEGHFAGPVCDDHYRALTTGSGYVKHFRRIRPPAGMCEIPPTNKPRICTTLPIRWGPPVTNLRFQIQGDSCLSIQWMKGAWAGT